MSSLVRLLPLGLALVAEAAWIAVLAGLLDAFALHGPGIGVPGLLLVAVLGVLAARVLGPRLGERWARVAVALAALAGAIGWLASPAVRALISVDGVAALGPALAANPGGWLAALAFVRGMAHARLPVDPQRVGTMLAVGVPGLAVAALIGGMVSEPWRSTYLAAAQLQILLFLVTAIAALALARLGQVGAGSRLDASRNPAWLVLLGGLVVAAAALAALTGAFAGSGIATLAGALIVPLLVVGFVIGFDRRSLRILFISVLAMGLLGFGIRTVTSGAALSGAPATGFVPPTEGDPQTQTGLALGILFVLLVASAVVVMLLARMWLRRNAGATMEDDEERVIDHGGEVDARPMRRVRRFGRRSARPTDAVGAYLAMVAALEGRVPVAREAGETPAEHARRLRTEGHGSLPLDLLAADVGLARFAGIDLGANEDRRAVLRADRTRRALLLVPVEGPAAVAATATPTGPVTRGGRRAQGPGADVLAAEDPGTLGAFLTRIRRGP